MSRWLDALLPAALATTLLVIAPASMAQTNAVGSIYGSSGNPGAEVVVTNVETGAVRTTSTDANGRFAVTALPPGTYSAKLKEGDRTVATRESIFVTIGSGSEVSFATAELDEVTVTATRRTDIDMSATDTRSVFTAESLEKLSVGLSVEDVSLLAPGAIRGDSRYNTDRGRSSVSFGGSGANENAFYINGYAVTDPLRGLGSSSLPFNGISQMQLLTGGYGAEFGRSTGGVVNIVTKRGTNDWVAGAMVNFSPESLEASRHDSYFKVNGTPSDGTLWADNSQRHIQSTLYSGYVGGPIIEDKLFFYVSGELEKRKDDGPRPIRNTTGTQAVTGEDGWFDRDYDVPRWLAKVDWNIAEGHTLELTGISDVQKQKRDYFGFYSGTNSENLAPFTKGDVRHGGFDYKDGGETYIARYTGAITENLIFTGLYGRSKNVHEELPIGYDPSVTAIRDNRSIANTLSFGPFTTLRDIDSYDKTDGFRLDLEWLLGRHDIRGGYDVQNLEILDGTVTSGPGYFWNYDNTDQDPIPGSGGAANPGGNGDYVEKVISIKGGKFKADQYAFFLEDRFQVTDQLMVSLGLRNENFKNYAADGSIFLDQTNQWAPRLGISYNVFGDSRTRVFANAGRYHLAIPLNLALRQVGATTNTNEYFAFTGIDPSTGEPLGLTALGNGPFSNNNEYGQARDPRVAAAKNLKPYFQDEFAFGFESKFLGDYVGGARFIFRKLGSQIDDVCDPRIGYNWAARNGYASGVDAQNGFSGTAGGNGLDDGAEHFAVQLLSCVIINPGESNSILLNAGTIDAPDYVDVNLSAADIGLQKVKRKYQGLDLFIEHPLRDNWYAKLDWTISRSRGNAEGQLLSDIGQADVAATLNWDYAEMMSHSEGPLPNDRKHQVKAFGFYQVTPQWRVSGTLTVASGRPKSPSGLYGGEPLLAIEPTAVGTCSAQCFFDNYVDYGGPYYRYVNGELSPRGSGGRFPWTTVFDLGASYSPAAVKGLTVGLDIFNLFNRQQSQNQVDFAESGGPGLAYASTNKVLSYNSPRTVRFGVRYDWGQ